MKILFLSHTSAGGVFLVGSHHLSRELAGRGHEVWHFSTPRTPLHVIRALVRGEGIHGLAAGRRSHAGRMGVVDVVPWAVLPLSLTRGRLSRFIARADVTWWRIRYGLGRPDVVFVDQPLLGDHAIEIKPRAIIYRPTDGHFDKAVRSAELELLRRSEGIAATSAETLNVVMAGAGCIRPTVVIENGVEFDLFDATEFTGARSGAVYVGAIDQRFDWQIIKNLALAYPHQKFTIAGPVVAEPPRALPVNVSLVGPVSYAEIGALLRSALVGLLPLTDTPANATRSPMKYYEYLASGVSVLATRTPALESRADPNVWLYSGLQEAVRGFGEALSATSATRVDGINRASMMSWKSRASHLEDFASDVLNGDAS